MYIHQHCKDAPGMIHMLEGMESTIGGPSYMMICSSNVKSRCAEVVIFYSLKESLRRVVHWQKRLSVKSGTSILLAIEFRFRGR